VAALTTSLSAWAKGPQPAPTPEAQVARMEAENRLISQFQILGSHNSYRTGPNLAAQSLWGPARPGGFPELDYGHGSLTHQLDLGIRQLEIDPYADTNGGLYADDYAFDPVAFQIMRAPGAKVLHIPKFDPRVNCLTLALCLGEIASWSDRHPDHLPLTILINPQEIGPASRSQALEPMSAQSLDEFDATARQAFGGKLVTPDMIRGDQHSLRQAVVTSGWPKLAALRGRILLVLDTGPVLSDLYRAGHSSLRGRAMFCFYPEADDEAAIFNIQDPLREEARINNLVSQGFLVRTRSDADTFEARDQDYRRLAAAKRSGAQFISTDFYPGYVDPWHFGFTADLDGKLVTSNPVTSPSSRKPSHRSADNLAVEKVIYLYRHGLRTPLADEVLAAPFAAVPFPEWRNPNGSLMPEGSLTEHGAAAARAMGKWNRDWLMAHGLFSHDICAAPARIGIHTNTVPRTIDTGHALAQGLAPDCQLRVHHETAGTIDPLFASLQARDIDFDQAKAAKAILDYAGGLDQLVAPYRAELAMLGAVLGCSRSSMPACDLAAQKSALTLVPGQPSPNLSGLIRMASGAAQIYLLQYAQGFTMSDVAWGRADARTIARLSRFHGVLVNALTRPAYLSDRISGPLGIAMAQDLMDTDQKVKIYVGHDGNLAAMAARLGLHFKASGYGFDDPPIGGAFRIEVLRDPASPHRFVRISLEAQTPDQIRNLTDISVQNPPYVEALEIGGCGRGQGHLCPVETFARLLRSHR
jgi:hypothetical protein